MSLSRASHGVDASKIPTYEEGNSPQFPVNMHNSIRMTGNWGRFSFAFVRHPLNWYASFWSYRMLTGWDRMEPLDPCMAVLRAERRALTRFGYLP